MESPTLTDQTTPQIMVIDDDPTALRATVRVLSAAGYDVFESTTGLQGLKLIKANRPDLVLLDVVLPDIDGVQLCGLIKSDPELSNTYVVLLSGFRVDSEEQAAGLEKGADGYIARPVGNRELLARIEAMFRLKEARDIQARQSAELERSNADLAQFAYVVSHDLQEPLRMVTSYLKLLERRYRQQLDSEALEFIDFAVDGAERMRLLINDLLKYSRLNTQAKSFKPTDCNLVLENVLSNLQIAITESQATIRADPLPTLRGDQVQLEQLFQNLIGNALKFRGETTPQIHVAAERDHHDWRFSIGDNGIGFDPAQSDRIFEIFQRLHGREDGYPGTGMGLAICKKVVERHGGQIWVETEPDQGATFYFTLPISEP